MSKQSQSSIVVLLGSGVSCAAKLPDVMTLSSKVVCGVSGDESKLLHYVSSFQPRRMVRGETLMRTGIS
jgi:hypothetical protein